MAWPSFYDEVASFWNYRYEMIRTSETRSCPRHCASIALRCSSSVSPRLPTFVSFALVGLTEILVWCHWVGSKLVTVRFLGEGYIYPSTPTYSLREPSEWNTIYTTHFRRENHLLMCWDQDILILPFKPWFLAFLKLLFIQSPLLPNPNLWESDWVLGRLSFEAQEEGFHHQEHHQLPFG